MIYLTHILPAESLADTVIVLYPRLRVRNPTPVIIRSQLDVILSVAVTLISTVLLVTTSLF